MNWQLAIFYGVTQGLTEFLPVSSSGHLALLPHFFHFADPGPLFDLLMHVGTAFAVILYFRRDLVSLLRQLPVLFTPGPKAAEGYFLRNLIGATAVSVLVALLLKDVASFWGRNLSFITFNLAFFGLLLWGSDYGKPFTKVTEDDLHHPRGLKWALLLGLTQVLALFPGVSRSGIVFTVARALGLSRAGAGRFSFLLSLPLILGGAVIELLEGQVELSIDQWHFALLGMIVAFGVGVFSIHFFFRLVERLGVGIFAIYRILFAAVVYWLLVSV